MSTSHSDSPLVLIAPAMAIGSAYYRPLVEAFQNRGWQARALTRRGFEKDAPRAGRGSDWSYADEIDDIAHAVESARAEFPSRPVLLLGHSLGGQLVVGHELTRTPADGVITVGAAIPHYRHFRHAGLPLLVMAAGIVPATTALFGYLPKPAFGAPGARSLMREWARMVLTGRTPFPVAQPIETPSLIISLDDDDLSPRAAVDVLTAQLFVADAVDRWHYRNEDVPTGSSNDHIAWVRTPGPVVGHVTDWWATLPPP